MHPKEDQGDLRYIYKVFCIKPEPCANQAADMHPVQMLHLR